jgi:hypothetical protein
MKHHNTGRTVLEDKRVDENVHARDCSYLRSGVPVLVMNVVPKHKTAVGNLDTEAATQMMCWQERIVLQSQHMPPIRRRAQKAFQRKSNDHVRGARLILHLVCEVQLSVIVRTVLKCTYHTNVGTWKGADYSVRR